jgi:hypothetical protein
MCVAATAKRRRRQMRLDKRFKAKAAGLTRAGAEKPKGKTKSRK